MSEEHEIQDASGTRGRRAIFTIVANNYLHFARTLLQSVQVCHPESDCFCILVDRDPAPAAALGGGITVIRLGELALPDGEAFAFQYAVMELCTAVKPWAFARILDRGYRNVIYLDPDIFVYRALGHVYDQLEGTADIVLTPHLLAPVADLKKPGELEIRQSGTYNLGFCALRASANTRNLLAWWQAKLVRGCVVDLKRGIFVDQSWMDLVPGLFANVAVLRHTAYNVAYWNLAQRRVGRDAEGVWTVDDVPLAFFHFSGFDPFQPEGFSRHQDRFVLSHLGVAAELVVQYGQKLIDNGAAGFAREPYGYARFNDGAPIPESLRRMYRGSERMRSQLGSDPFGRPDALQMPSSAFGVQWHFERSDHIARPMLSGLSPLESNVADEGIWASRRASIYLTGPAGGEVRVAGAYFPHAVLLATGRADSTLSFWCGERLVHQCGLVDQGDFEVVFDLPDGLDFSDEMLRIECSGSFVPSKIAINAHDPRNLAWRIKRLSVGGIDVVDYRRAPPLLSADDHAAVRGVNLICYSQAESGVGEAARSWAKAASAACIPYSILDVGYQNPNVQRDTTIVEGAVGEWFDVDMVYVNADQTQPTLDYLRRVRQPARIVLGFWHWEQPELPARQIAAFDGLTEVWVPSSFVHDAVARVAPVPVFKVPHAIEFAVTPGNRRSTFALPEDRFLVLVMYDFHSYQSRKNPQAAIEAFRQAFRGSAGAALVVKTVNADKYPDKYEALRAGVSDLADIHFIDGFLTRQEIYDLEACCDCMLSLHRAEGFGLGLAEMMYLGKPVIATGWSGNMEFMTPMNSFPLAYELRKLTRTEGAYEAGQEWAEADIEQAAAVLRRLAGDAALVRDVGRRAAASIREQLSPLAIGKRFRKRLSHLAWTLVDA